MVRRLCSNKPTLSWIASRNRELLASEALTQDQKPLLVHNGESGSSTADSNPIAALDSLVAFKDEMPSVS